MGIDPALNWSSLFSYFLSQIKCLQQLICKGYPHAYKFHGTSRFIDNLCTINVNGEFSSSYPKQLGTKLWHQREQFPGDLVTFTKKALMENFFFCAVTIEDNIFVYKLFEKRDNFLSLLYICLICRAIFYHQYSMVQYIQSSYKCDQMCSMYTKTDRFSAQSISIMY